MYPNWLLSNKAFSENGLEIEILQTAHDLHMFSMGSAEFPLKMAQRMASALQYRLSIWKENFTGEKGRGFSDAVKNLVKIVLVEYENCPWR